MERLYNKYRIEKQDGSTVDPNAIYFVLRLDTDPAARAAAQTYANCIAKDKPQFAEDIYLLVEKLTPVIVEQSVKQWQATIEPHD